jgi:peptidoglycan/xylan/chitin deacetylase (PgdA/CDA1 family)
MPRDFDMNVSDESIYANIKQKIKPGSIIVLHDGHINSARTARILPRLIGIIREKRLSFALLKN